MPGNPINATLVRQLATSLRKLAGQLAAGERVETPSGEPEEYASYLLVEIRRSASMLNYRIDDRLNSQEEKETA